MMKKTIKSTIIIQLTFQRYREEDDAKLNRKIVDYLFWNVSEKIEEQAMLYTVGNISTYTRSPSQ